MAGAAERQRARFRVEPWRRQRAEQVADEVKRSEQSGGGQAELQVAREGREYHSVGDASDANIKADRKHRDGQQHEGGILRSGGGRELSVAHWLHDHRCLVRWR